jgi:alginate O-acetyltransferase complex protein AlgI
MVVFFPHLIAGPIVNHRILMRQFMSKARLRVTAPTLALGIGLFVFGLAKKVLFADGMADAVARGASPGFADTWIGALAYMLQLYFDFSGYSDAFYRERARNIRKTQRTFLDERVGIFGKLPRVITTP